MTLNLVCYATHTNRDLMWYNSPANYSSTAGGPSLCPWSVLITLIMSLFTTTTKYKPFDIESPFMRTKFSCTTRPWRRPIIKIGKVWYVFIRTSGTACAYADFIPSYSIWFPINPLLSRWLCPVLRGYPRIWRQKIWLSQSKISPRTGLNSPWRNFSPLVP